MINISNLVSTLCDKHKSQFCITDTVGTQVRLLSHIVGTNLFTGTKCLLLFRLGIRQTLIINRLQLRLCENVCVSDPLDVLHTRCWLVSQLLHGGDGRVAEIWRLTVHHLHHHDAQRPDVHLDHRGHMLICRQGPDLGPHGLTGPG